MSDYSTNLSDKGWALIEPLLVRPDPRGKRDKYDKRMMMNALLYWVKTGCQWRMLPKDFGIPWFVIYDRYRRWNQQGVWERILCTLVEASRLHDGRSASPTYAIIDSQSVKTAYHGKARGIDGGKKIKGRKRHIVVDTQGHVLAVHVHAANRHDSVAAPVVMARTLKKYPTITGICGDAGYRGTASQVIETLTNCVTHIVEKLPSGWSVLPKRWIVERTIAWLNTNRRLAKDYEINPKNSENVVRIAAIRAILPGMT